MGPSIFFVIVGAVAVAAVARWRGWPAPLLVTLVALPVSFLPFIPAITIDGHLLLNIVLPPLLYSAALDVSFVSFRRAMPQIRRLGVGLVIVTAAVVGLLAWWVMPELTLPGALLLGAIVAPPDAVSAASIGRRLGLPRRVMTVLSGESLINDATSLTMFRVFSAIVAGATVTVWGGIWQFLVAVGVGVAVGLVFGVALHQLRMRLDDPTVNGTFGLLAPFGAYAIAEQLMGSGVLAVVAMGLFVGFHAPKTSYATRQQEAPLWLSADFLLESFVFAYIGLQLPHVLGELGEGEGGTIILLSVVVFAAVLVVRPLFVYPASAWGRWGTTLRLRKWKGISAAAQTLPDAVSGRRRRHPISEEQLQRRLVETRLSWRDNAVVSWAGMRGVVTLATALAAADLAALDTQAAHAIVVVAFVVTVGTLLLQGLTLPGLIRRLGVIDDSERQEDQRELEAVRERSREAGKAYLRRMRRAWAEKQGEQALPAFDAYAKRLMKTQTDAEHGDEPQQHPTAEQFASLMKGWLTVRRRLLLEERRAGTLNEEVMREVIAAMDAEELALDTRMALRD